jgi:membrane-bound metal-dependent hydrolase YbcI (DUF457 family)
MDPLSHVALGRTVAVFASNQRAPIVAAILGALSPDLDAAFMPLGWDVYLRVHEIGTHTLPGTLGCGLLTAGAVRPFTRSSSYGRLAAVAWAGAVSHIVLDLLSGARLRLAWPFADPQVSIPLVAMADPWLLTLLVAGAGGLWIGLSRTRTATWMITTVAVFLLMKAALGIGALTAYRTARPQAPGRVSERVIEAKWASLLTWNVFDRTTDSVRFWRTTAGQAADLVLSWPIGVETPAITASRSLSTVRNFLRVHRLGFAVTVPQPAGGYRVLWSDIRYCWDAGTPGAAQVEPVIRSVRGTRLACALWFGGEFDALGRPMVQIVQIGSFRQTRLPGW